SSPKREDRHARPPPRLSAWSRHARRVAHRHAAQRIRAGKAAREGSLHRSRALDSLCARLRGHGQRLFQRRRPRRGDDDRARRRQNGGGAAHQQRGIALIGPEASIYVQNGDSPTTIPIFGRLTMTDGFMLIGREKADKFDWQQLKGKQILALRPGSTPDLFLEAALRQNGIDPFKDVKLVNNIAIPARVGSWLAGQNQYAIFMDPD